MNTEQDPASVSTSHPVGDFFIGFLLTVAVEVACFFSIVSIPPIGIPASIVLLAGTLILAVVFFTKKRNALAVGICSALAIPLLLFGTCAVILNF